MTKRIDILKASLEKKQNTFDARLQNHFDDVRSANGQPLNDKRNGYRTLNRWDKQNDSLRNHQKEIEKTERAIEREEVAISYCRQTIEKIPEPIRELVESGVLIQWRKFPNTFFVEGVEKGRIGFDFKKNIVFNRYAGEIPTKEQFKKFKNIYNALNKKLNLKDNQP